MARIPVFRDTSARAAGSIPSLTSRVRAPGPVPGAIQVAGAPARAVAGFAGTVADIATDRLRKQRAEQKILDKLDDEIELAELSNRLGLEKARLQTEAEEAEDPTGLTETGLATFDKFQKSELQNIADTEQRRRAEKLAIEDFRGPLEGQLLKTENTKRNDRLNERMDTALAEFETQIFRRPGQYPALLRQAEQRLDDLAAAAPAASVRVDERKEKFRAAAGIARVRGLIGKDPETMESALKDGKFDALLENDLDVIRKLTGEATKAAKKARDRREASFKATVGDIEDDVDDAVKVLDAGYTPENMADLADDLDEAEKTAVSMGKPETVDDIRDMRRELGLAQTAADFAGGFGLLRPDQQRAVLNKMESGKVKTADEVDLIERLDKIQKNTETALQNDALTHGVRVGLIDPPPPVDFTDDDALATAIGERQTSARAVAEHYGVPALPFTEEELDALSVTVEQMDADGRTALLGTLAGALGETGLPPVMEKIAPKQPLFAFAAGVALSDPATARRILKGQDIIDADRKILPPVNNVFRTQMKRAMGDAFIAIPRTRATAAAAANAWYAAAASDENDFTGKLDVKRLLEAVNAVTGGIFKWNGQHIVSPISGLDDDVFDDMMEQVTDADLGWTADREDGPRTMNGGKVTADMLRDNGTLLTIGDARYRVIIAGFPAQGPDGRAYMLNMRPLLPDLLRRVEEAEQASGGPLIQLQTVGP